MSTADLYSSFYEALSPRMTSDDLLNELAADMEPMFELGGESAVAVAGAGAEAEGRRSRAGSSDSGVNSSDGEEDCENSDTSSQVSQAELAQAKGSLSADQSLPLYQREDDQKLEPLSSHATTGLDQNGNIRVGEAINQKQKNYWNFASLQKYTVGLLPIFNMDLDMIKEVCITTVLLLWGLVTSLVISLVPRRFRYKDVSGQIVLVTGAGSGIGRLMAIKFALEHKAIVVIWDVNKQGAEATAKDIRNCGGKAYSYVVDVTKREVIYEAAKKVSAEVGKVDILINNAGIVSGAKFLETRDEMIEKTFQVNALANFWTTKAFLPAMMKDDRGHIVTIASTAGLVGVNRLVDYCASKYAAVGFHEALLTELKSEMQYEGIHATVVCPYYINTGMFDGVSSKLLPILEPEDVVNDIVAGVLTNQESIVIPRYCLALVLAKHFVPSKVGHRFQAILGITGTMLTFKGRSSTTTVSAPPSKNKKQ